MTRTDPALDRPPTGAAAVPAPASRRRASVRTAFRTLPCILQMFLAGIALLTAADLLIRLLCAHGLHLPQYPYGYYILRHNEDGLDLMGYYVRFQQFHSPLFFRQEGGPVYAYPAGVAPFYWLFYRARYAQIPFVLFSGAVLIYLSVLLARALERHGLRRSAARLFVAASLVLSYPFFFECTRGNMEFLVWLFCAAGAYAVLRDRPWLGATLIGIATAMKMFPFVLVGLLISRKQYRHVLYALVLATAFTYAAYWMICPNVPLAIAGIRDGVSKFQVKYVLAYWVENLDWDHSLFGVMKRIAGAQPTVTYAHMLSVYMAVCAGAGTLLYFLRIRRLPVANQVLCLSVASIMMPPISFDYTLMHLYTAWAVLVVIALDAYRSGRPQTPGMWPIFACLTVLLSPLGEFIVGGHRLNGNIRAIVLLVLFVLGLVYRLPGWMDKEHRHGSAATVQ